MSETVTADGRVAIPKPIQDALGVGPGSEVTFRQASQGVLIERVGEAEPPKRSERWRERPIEELTTDELMEFLRGEA